MLDFIQPWKAATSSSCVKQPLQAATASSYDIEGKKLICSVYIETSKLCELEKEARTFSREIKHFEISVIFQNTKKKLNIRSKVLKKI
jgi:ABC-type dipeptide/oligopeptide/nickel transport system ATPase component